MALPTFNINNKFSAGNRDTLIAYNVESEGCYNKNEAIFISTRFSDYSCFWAEHQQIILGMPLCGAEKCDKRFAFTCDFLNKLQVLMSVVVKWIRLVTFCHSRPSNKLQENCKTY